MTIYVDLAEKMSEEMINAIGELTICLGRLEHMVLLAIKRKRSINLSTARSIYGTWGLGQKLFGNQRSKEPSLSDLAQHQPELMKICEDIRAVKELRNKYIHGLFATVENVDVVIDTDGMVEISRLDIWSIIFETRELIDRLDRAVPIPGRNITLATGWDLSVSYDDQAIDSSDPLVTKGKANE